MKIAHLAVVTPGRCGLYETSRELCVGLRGQGYDARLVDPTREKNKLYPGGDNERGAPLADMEWALGADLLINHSGYDNTPLEKTEHPVIHICHGRPRSSFLSETKGSTPIYSYHYAKNKDPRIKAVVTFWPEHDEYHRFMFPDKKVFVVQAPADLSRWKIDGPSGYKFKGRRGLVNIVMTDPFRDDVDIFVPLHAAGLFAREVAGTRIHVFAKGPSIVKGWNCMLRRIHEDGNLGEVAGWVGGLDNVYRAATMMLTANDIATRSVREAQACGCPVVRMSRLDDQWRVRMRKAMAMKIEDRVLISKQAAASFNPSVTARQFAEVIKETVA